MTHTLPDKLKMHNMELNKLTMESITQALIQLIKTTDYEKISVTDICLKAGVSRNAFYNNFKTKENVLKTVILDFNKDVILRKVGNPFNRSVDEAWYIKFFTEIKEHSDLIEVIIKSNLKDFYLDYVSHILTANPNLDKKTRYYRLMWNGAIQNAALEWIRRGMVESVEEIAKISYELLQHN